MSTRGVWNPHTVNFPSTNYPQPGTIHSTGRRPVLAFDATTAETCYLDGNAPQGLTGALTLIVKSVMASAITGGIAWEASVEAITPLDAVALATAESFDSVNTGTVAAVPGTLIEFEVSVTLTNADGMVAGDRYRIKLTRATGHASDTATGDALVTSVELRDAA